MANPIVFPSTTRNFSFPLLFAGQAQKEVTLNHATSLLDALLTQAVESSRPSPPIDAAEGSCFRITSPASGAWSAHEDEIAVRLGGSWHFSTPHQGQVIYDRERNVMLRFNTTWHQPIDPGNASGGTVVDTEARQVLQDIVSSLRDLGFLADGT